MEMVGWGKLNSFLFRFSCGHRTLWTNALMQIYISWSQPMHQLPRTLQVASGVILKTSSCTRLAILLIYNNVSWFCPFKNFMWMEAWDIYFRHVSFTDEVYLHCIFLPVSDDSLCTLIHAHYSYIVYLFYCHWVFTFLLVWSYYNYCHYKQQLCWTICAGHMLGMNVLNQ